MDDEIHRWGSAHNQGGAHPPQPPGSSRPRRRLPGPWWLWALVGLLLVALVSVATSKGSGTPDPAPTVTVTEPGPTVTETEDASEPAATETPTEETEPPEEPDATIPEPTAESSTPQDVYYENCDEARAAGAAPLYAGEPGYSSDLDRDGDGVACEP
ncbi:excalibur calcium-binding domain-containing protein [Streptomyces sp. NPDC050844]|uniref:excalibur calcium-binding domain-containing protein n=1 Tax=Streptomyces sp. NPDC050844 TaxID=3155790 RepID=UPI0033EE0F05